LYENAYSKCVSVFIPYNIGIILLEIEIGKPPENPLKLS
jgi:hypothetical protein